MRDIAIDWGMESLEAARTRDHLVDALVKNGKAGSPETLELAEQAVRLKSNRTRDTDLDLALSLHNLGVVHTERGEYKAAVDAHERALTFRTGALEATDSRIAESLELLAIPLILLEQFSAAGEKLDVAQRIREHDPARSPPGVARTLQIRALLDRWRGDYSDGLRRLNEAIAARGEIESPDDVATLQLRGELLLLGGDIASARSTWSDALALATRQLRPDHPAIVPLLRDLEVTERALGNLTESRRLLERALEITDKSMAPCHPEIPMVLGDLASVVKFDGDYERAKNLLDRAFQAFDKCLTPNHSLTATIVHNQAFLASEMGDLATAQRLHERAVRMWTLGLGPNHPYVARGLDALAEVVAARGDLPMARRLFTRALNIRRRAFGENHPDVAWTLSNLAQLLGTSGETALALTRLDEALAIYKTVGLSYEPDHLARSLALRGRLLERRSDFTNARATFAEGLRTREQIFGAAHPLTASARADVGRADFALGNADAALASALDAEQTGRDHLRFTIRYLPERQAMAYAAARPRGLDLALSIAAANHSLEPVRVLDGVIRSRGVILDELAARAQSTSLNADPQVAALNSSLTAARQRFATLMLRSLQGEESVPAPLLDEARQRKEDAERTLAERSATAREEAARAQAGLDDVRRSLPAGSALVSFVRYDRTSIVTRASRRVVATTPSYIALVARADKADVQVVPLGTASSIERLVEAWRSQADGSLIAAGTAPREAERTYRVAAASLRLRIWDPIAGAIAGATRVFIVPDGALNLVSFAALPMGSRYLLENGPAIHYLSTERDLVRSDPMAGHGLLALGGPAFDVRVSNAAAAVRRSAGCATIGALRFEDLPGSRAEIQDIAKIWGDQDDVLMLSGRAATKMALTQAIVGRKVVHLATHGFFLGSGCEPTMPRTRGVGGVVTAKAVPTDNPLLLAGLALAGVNTLSRTNQANGILNAEEIAGLNLQGTEWAVLSACDTGLGQITAGEGVFGLRRALQIAGVRTIIMSLWSVEDRSTRDWMKALYEARLTKQLDTPDSVRAASVHVLEDRRKRGMSTHPFYWAAFVAAGDWR